jgi:hypothetical protein
MRRRGELWKRCEFGKCSGDLRFTIADCRLPIYRLVGADANLFMIHLFPDAIQKVLFWLSNPFILVIGILAVLVGAMWMFSWLSKK